MKPTLSYRIVGTLLIVLGIGFVIYAFMPTMPGVTQARSGRATLTDCFVGAVPGSIALYVGWRFLQKAARLDQARR